MYELVICEKPKAALRIAESLADGKPEKVSVKGVPYYKLTHKKKKITVGCAVGHLFVLAETNGGTWKYPIFDVSWQPIYKVRKITFSKKYFDVLKKLSKDAKEFTIACDYDIEGETIGLNVLRFICKKKDANRMKFSTLTKGDLVKAYEKKSKHIDWGLANAGETRHELDYYYGINLSRALTLAVKAAGSFMVLSSGRVQGPALKIIVDKEKEIKAFKSKPFWQIDLKANVNNKSFNALHEKDKFWKKAEAEKVMKTVKGQKKAIVKNMERKKFDQLPPTPFDLTSLQIEAYRCFRFSPKETLAIAQELYLAGLISYPRTSSQKLPLEIGYKRILNKIKKQDFYKSFCEKLLTKKLKPNNGTKTDPAHPAIYPTGLVTHIKEKNAQLYDLIMRRFLATFADKAVRETMKADLDVKGEIFITKGTRTVEKGWHDFYGKYVSFKDEEFPRLEKGKTVDVEKIDLTEKQTQPPKRYTPASIIKELTKRNLGTKATRAAIIDTLYQRHYVKNEAIEATELGMCTVETLEKYSPRILDEELTRHFEEELEKIQNKKKKPATILKEAKTVLKKILTDFKKKEKKIGEGLKEAIRVTRREASIIGPCPNCEGDMRILFSRKTKKFFAACNKYPDCKTTYPLPAGKIVKTGKVCEKCNTPIIKVIRRAKRPFEMCLDPKCETKAHWNKKT